MKYLHDTEKPPHESINTILFEVSNIWGFNVTRFLLPYLGFAK